MAVNESLARLTFSEPTKWIVVYKNGDKTSLGRRIVIKPREVRTFDKLLEEITGKLKPSFGAVRNIFTPEGGTRVSSLSRLQTEGRYVAAAADMFKPLNKARYTDLPVHTSNKSLQSLRSSVAAKPTLAADETTPGRIRNSTTICIQVYKNGDVLSPPASLRLDRSAVHRWQHTLTRIGDKLQMHGSVNKLYNLRGQLVRDPVNDLQHNGVYVATASGDKFRLLNYETAHRPVIRKSSILSTGGGRAGEVTTSSRRHRSGSPTARVEVVEETSSVNASLPYIASPSAGVAEVSTKKQKAPAGGTRIPRRRSRGPARTATVSVSPRRAEKGTEVRRARFRSQTRSRAHLKSEAGQRAEGSADHLDHHLPATTTKWNDDDAENIHRFPAEEPTLTAGLLDREPVEGSRSGSGSPQDQQEPRRSQSADSRLTTGERATAELQDQPDDEQTIHGFTESEAEGVPVSEGARLGSSASEQETFGYRNSPPQDSRSARRRRKTRTDDPWEEQDRVNMRTNNERDAPVGRRPGGRSRTQKGLDGDSGKSVAFRESGDRKTHGDGAESDRNVPNAGAKPKQRRIVKDSAYSSETDSPSDDPSFQLTESQFLKASESKPARRQMRLVQVDLDTDAGGVYRSPDPIIGHVDEIEDATDMQIEVPVDLKPTDEVDEEV